MAVNRIPCGWCGKIARIDLTSKQWTVEIPDPETLMKFIGGRGLAGFYLRDHITLNWDDPDMPLLLFTGPLVNTPSPTSGRMTIMSRSPLTGTIGDCSVGGSLGVQLKSAGFDGIIITGKSDLPCGIEIEDHAIRFASAESVTGMSTSDACRIFKPKGAVAVTGPAAERGVLYSNVIIDGHYAAGRNGLGLVFASKKLKYITVRGTGKTGIYDSEELRRAKEDILRLVAASPAIMGHFGISRFGTGALYDLMDARCMMPTDNFRNSRFHCASSMNAVAYAKQYHPVKTGCRGCHIRCKKKNRDGIHIPEFETMSHFSALLGNCDMKTVIEANRICNDLGMDTISAAVTLACYAEITEKRLSPEQILRLLSETGTQKNPGRDLGVGAARMAQQHNRPEFAMAVKRQELPAYDPRGAYGMALAYAVSTRGACHLRAYPISHEILRKPVATDRFSFEGKARIIKINEDVNAVVDSLTVCKFVFFAATLEEYARVFSAVTGLQVYGQDLLKTGERICYLERMMNAQNGFGKADDDLPSRFFETPGYISPTKKNDPINRDRFMRALADYYTVRGLDENGMPVLSRAKELGLV
ncbi:MAG: aldehyde ferredoxin oxidoreductase family protein [Desulfobacterales bacterium]|nr:aldehyde ferredoxin oxidoreductase family protein [Desulfobacterales bacterium]MDD4072614.1 aldehyde ferredoxin oxidoreductase family protein [Desulfobacterales bacterium]MDD4392352.1 aldehyde ferredoxin oxidoreductase family protein [Desulfobacterales bacterium]